MVLYMYPYYGRDAILSAIQKLLRVAHDRKDRNVLEVVEHVLLLRLLLRLLH